MKVTLAKAEECIITYINKELCPKFGDWRKWVLPVMMSSCIPTMEKKFYENKDILVSSGFVDKEDMIDIDLIYDKFHRVAETNGDITQDIPLLGTVKFSSRDIETLYRLARI